jgi:hypothetical protein
MTQRPTADRYVVEGKGPFPVEMLRRDCAEPASDADRLAIEAASGEPPSYERRRISLVTSERATLDKRWESFGWRVVRPLRPWSPLSGYHGPEIGEDLPPLDTRHVVTMRVVCPDARTAFSAQCAMSEAARRVEGATLEPSCIEPYPQYRKALLDELER